MYSTPSISIVQRLQEAKRKLNPSLLTLSSLALLFSDSSRRLQLPNLSSRVCGVCLLNSSLMVGTTSRVLLYHMVSERHKVFISSVEREVRLRGTVVSICSIGPYGYVLIVCENKCVLIKITEFGDVVFEKEVSGNYRSMCSLDMCGRRLICLGGKNLLIVDEEGKECFRKKFQNEIMQVVSDKTLVWIGCRNGDVLSLHSHYKLIKKFYLRSCVTNLSVNREGLLCVCCANGFVAVSSGDSYEPFCFRTRFVSCHSDHIWVSRRNQVDCLSILGDVLCKLDFEDVNYIYELSQDIVFVGVGEGGILLPARGTQLTLKAI